MEIYEHKAVFGSQPPPQKDKGRTAAVIAVILAGVAALLSVITLILCLIYHNKGMLVAKVDDDNYELAFQSVKDSCVEVYGNGTKGSGVVYKISGGKTYVITNNHVLNGATVINARFSAHGDTVNGTVLGSDEYHDIALIEYDGSFGTPVKSGSAPRVGTKVMAVGNNLGYGIAAFDGIVSHTSRMLHVTDSDKTVPVYAVTSPINAGMSGGGLFTLSGEIIGINTYQTTTVSDVSSPNRPVDGMSYCVPYSIAQTIARRIFDSRGDYDELDLDITGDNNVAGGIVFTGLYIRAAFDSEGLKIYTVGFSSPPLEMRGGAPEAGDIIKKIGSLDITEQTTYADIFAECLRYEHNPALDSQTLKIELGRGKDTVTVSYEYKRLRY